MEVNSNSLGAVARLWRGGLVIGCLALATIAVSRLRDASQATAQPPVASIGVASDTSQETVDETVSAPVRSEREAPAMSERLLGVWHLEKHGHRTLTIHADGTATVDVRLNMLGALMYGEQLMLDLTWTLEGDVMSQVFESGTPEDSVQRLIRDWGDLREYRIVKLTDDELVMAEVEDEDDLDVWTRIRPEAEGRATTTAGQTEQSPR